MKKIEKKIIEEVYRLETKRTFLQVIRRIFELLILVFLGYLFISILVEEWFRQQTLDLLLNFTEGIEVAGHYFFDNLMIVYQETPKTLQLLILFLLVLIGLFVRSIAKNKKIMQNKVRVLVKFWFDH